MKTQVKLLFPRRDQATPLSEQACRCFQTNHKRTQVPKGA